MKWIFSLLIFSSLTLGHLSIACEGDKGQADNQHRNSAEAKKPGHWKRLKEGVKKRIRGRKS